LNACKKYRYILRKEMFNRSVVYIDLFI
jgi:hypothetical protein